MSDDALPGECWTGPVEGQLSVVWPADRARWLADLLTQYQHQALDRDELPPESLDDEIEVLRRAASIHELTGVCRVRATESSAGPDPASLWVSTVRAAELSGVTEGAIRKRIERGLLPDARRCSCGSGWVIPAESLAQSTRATEKVRDNDGRTAA